MKLVREHINEKFREESDPISDMNIGMTPQRIKQMYEDGINGYYLTKAGTKYEIGWAYDNTAANYTDIGHARFLLYSPESEGDDSFHDYLEDKLGKWTIKNADRWSKYTVIHVTEENVELYSW